MNQLSLPRHQRPSTFDQFLFGACYYPEHWDRSWIETDAALMAQAHVNVVRMAEFAWTLMEPRRGAFDFSLFKAAVQALKAQGIDTILCTPTATPPRWLTRDHPEWMRVDRNGVPFSHGTRQHCCTNHPEFRAESRRITRAMAEAFKDDAAVIGWQTDNEFYCHVDECYCESCQIAFRDWLRARYNQSVKELNHAWGTLFWSQQYDDFTEIEIPKKWRQPAPCNPSALLDYRRFLSDSITSFQREQVEILREVNPSWWITHNGVFYNIDYYTFAEDLDFLSVDVYPAFWGTKPECFIGASQLNERCRQATGTFLVPEQCGGPGGQLDFLQPTPEPGRMRLWAYQSIAHGADGMLHFRWRTCRYGAELHWHGILDHDNVPRRRFEEFTQEGAELKRIGSEILGTTKRVDVGISFGYEQDHAHAVMNFSRPQPDAQRELILAELMRRKIAVGYVNEADSYAGLKVLIVPSAIILDAVRAKKIEAFVAAGGVLLVTATTGQRDVNNHAIEQTLPGLLSEVLGITVEGFGKTEHRKMCLKGAGLELPADYYEIIKCVTAEPLAHWRFEANPGSEAAEGTVGLSCNVFGKGKAFYLGSFMNASSASVLLQMLCEQSGLETLGVADFNVCIIERRAEDRRLTFVLNNYPEMKLVEGLPLGRELITEKYCDGSLTVPAFGVAIVRS
ncbi:beta-galactosidase [Coraliomargarita sp. SDUM461004]|uniref:Beta-galactosidase n=1 Tax=Thalassobacterium sedimentorum TaxID=3041258 RepID=A0ABU1ADU7_9BACT|nr:beta-galactosidase [Coraliomargarita sp. SDUM461004]MDQ8192905.1 beta-galactosidase [Coraliomargarita sp. SDUM461004]